MAGIGDLVANLTVNSDGFSKGLNSSISQTKSWASGIGGVVAGIGAAMGAAWTVGSSVSGYKEALEGQRKLASVLEATGNAAGLTQSDIEDFAGQMQSLTNFEGDATVAASAMLASFTNIRGDAFTDTLEAAMNLSTVMGGDLNSNVSLLGKALNDPVDGMGRLAKAGVQFTDAQLKQVEAMQKAGDMAGAQQVILQALQDRFGGAAEAIADPWTQLTNTIGDIGEMFGSLLLPTVDLVASSVNTAGEYAVGFGELFKTAGIEAAAILSSLIDIWSGVASSIYDTVIPAVSSVWDWLTGLFGTVTGGIGSFAELYATAVAYLQNIGTVVGIAATEFQLFFVQLGNDAAHVFTAVLPGYTSWFADNWSDVLFTAVDYAATIFINLGQNIRNMWSAVLSFISGNGFEFDWTPLTEGAVSAISKLPDIPERVATQFEQQLQSDISGMTSNLMTDVEKARSDILAQQNVQRDAIVAKYSTEKPSAAMGVASPDIATGKEKGASDKTSLSAALAGSKESLQIAMRGIGGKNPAVDIAREQLKVSKDQLELQRQQSGTGFQEVVVAI